MKKVLNVKKVINGYNEEELQKWYEVTKEKNYIYEKENFPYIYNPNDKRINFLDAKTKTKSFTNKKPYKN